MKACKLAVLSCTMGLAATSASHVQAAAATAVAPKCNTVVIIEPYPPGGGTNIVARLVADKITAKTGITSYVDNQPGASGTIGSANAAKAKPDGCTIMIGTDATHAGNYYLFENFPYHPVNDFVPLAKAGTNIITFVGHPSVEADNLSELVELLRSGSKDWFYGSSGIGSPHHLAGELLNHLTGANMTHVPYPGGAPAIANLRGGQIPLLFSSLTSSDPHIKAGTIKVFGVTSAERYKALPNVPAIGEVVPGFEVNSWLAFFGPAGLKPEHVTFFNETVRETLNQPENKQNLQDMGLVVSDEPAEVFAEQQKADFESRGKLIRESGIKIQQ